MPPLTLTILGCSPAAPNVGGACSGYLVRDGDTAVLMDCGSGVAGRIAQHVPPNRLTAVAISHLHPDHYFDLVPLYYVLRFGPHRPPGYEPRVPLLVPPGGSEHVKRLTQLVAGSPTLLEDVFSMSDYAVDREFQLGSLRFTFHEVQHYVLSHAMRVVGADGATFVFSSDVGPCEALVDAARRADLLMCESALLDPEHDEPDPVRRGHMSAAEAGAAARAAGARQLLLTHYRSGEAYDARHREGASAAFGAPVDLAREGQTYTVSRA